MSWLLTLALAARQTAIDAGQTSFLNPVTGKVEPTGISPPSQAPSVVRVPTTTQVVSVTSVPTYTPPSQAPSVVRVPTTQQVVPISEVPQFNSLEDLFNTQTVVPTAPAPLDQSSTESPSTQTPTVLNEPTTSPKDYWNAPNEPNPVPTQTPTQDPNFPAPAPLDEPYNPNALDEPYNSNAPSDEPTISPLPKDYWNAPTEPNPNPNLDDNWRLVPNQPNLNVPYVEIIRGRQNDQTDPSDTVDDYGNVMAVTRTIGGTPMPADKGDNQGNLVDWTYGVLNRGGVVFFDIPTLQGAIPFQHQDRMPFSPFTTDLTTLDNLVLAGLCIKGLNKDNFKTFAHMAESYMDNMYKALGAVADMGAGANWANHTNATMLVSSMLHRMGMIDDAGYVRVQEHARSVFDKLYLSSFATQCLSGVTALANGSRSNEKGSSAGLANLLSLAKVT